MFAQHKLLLIALLLLSGFFLFAGNKGKVPSPSASGACKGKGAQASINKKLKSDYNKAKQEGRKELFKKMLEQADNPENDDATRFSLLKEAGMIAARVGDVENVILAMEELRKKHKGDISVFGVNLLDALSKKVKTPRDISNAAEGCLKLADDAINNNDFDFAVKAANKASQLALKIKDTSLADKCKAKINEISSLKKEGHKPISVVKKIEETKPAKEDLSKLKPSIGESKETTMEASRQEPATIVTPASPEDTMEIEAAEIPSMAASTLEAPCKSAEEENKLKSLDLKNLTAEWLKERRSFGSCPERPRPADYEFKEETLKAYLESLSGEKRGMEEKRAKQVRGVKEYLVHLMSKIPYNKSIMLKNGKTYTGSVMANPKYLSIRVKDGVFERVEWSSIGADQMARILEYYADFRMKATGGQAISESKQKLESAEDYLRIGMLHDWYGNYEQAVKYAKKAFSVYPNIETSVKCYMMQ